jgi:molybdopterin-binding protein
MKLSARNQLKAKVQSVTHGAVNSELILELPSGHLLVSIITRASAENLDLRPGSDAYGIVKTSSVMVAVD